MADKRQIDIWKVLEFLREEGEIVSYHGNRVMLSGYANFDSISDNSMIWLRNRSFLTENVKESIKQHKDVVVITTFVDECMENYIITEHPREVYFNILSRFFVEERHNQISEHAIVLSRKIGKHVNIGSGCYIGEDVEIADEVYIHPNVTIEGYCRIGTGTEIFSGTVIGTDGFGYYRKDGVPQKVPHFKGVIIGKNVDIGANTCIDRGCLGNTVIGDNVKIDNLCHIAHNVRIGDNCLVIAGSIVCGSAHIDEGAYIAPGSIVKNQVQVASGALVGMGAVVTKNIAPNMVVAGIPAKVLREVRQDDF